MCASIFSKRMSWGKAICPNRALGTLSLLYLTVFKNYHFKCPFLFPFPLPIESGFLKERNSVLHSLFSVSSE